MIRWTSNRVDHVDIDYSIDGGGSWANVVESLPADSGTTTWKVPDVMPGHAKIRIVDASDPNIFDVSKQDIVFYDLHLISPLPLGYGEHWQMRPDECRLLARTLSCLALHPQF